MPEIPWNCHTRLSVITVDPAEFGADRETLRLALNGRLSSHTPGNPPDQIDVSGDRLGSFTGRPSGDTIQCTDPRYELIEMEEFMESSDA